MDGHVDATDNIATPAELDGVPPCSAPRVEHGCAWNNAAFNEPGRDGMAFLLNWAIDQQIKGPSKFAVEGSGVFSVFTDLVARVA